MCGLLPPAAALHNRPSCNIGLSENELKLMKFIVPHEDLHECMKLASVKKCACTGTFC